MHVIYWRGSAEVRTELIQGLKILVSTVEERRSLEEVLDVVARRNVDLIIVDGSAGEREASSRIVELTSSEPLFDTPLAFISTTSAKRVVPLEGKFRSILPIDIPFDTKAIIKELERFLGKARELRQVQKGTAAKGEVGRPFLIKQTGNIGKLGGKQFATARNIGALSDDLVLPKLDTAPQLSEALNSLSAEDSWLGLHARRTAHLSSSLASVFSEGTVEDDNVRTVSLCLNLGFTEELKEFAHVDVSLQKFSDISQPLARAFMRGATFAFEALSNDRAARTINVISSLLRHEPFSENAQITKEAQLTLAAELADRACWSQGYWSVRGAYRIIRHFHEGRPLRFDDQVTWAIGRVLAEAASVHVTLESVVSAYARAGIYGTGPERNGREDTSEFEASVPIALVDLMPGMRLAKHLISRDGEIVLHARTELDSDLIKRLWRLVMVRPLCHPVTVAARLTHA